jgi:hypothetical protein
MPTENTSFSAIFLLPEFAAEYLAFSRPDKLVDDRSPPSAL